METLIILFMFAVGVFLIVKGGDLFVDAAAWMAEVSGIPKLIVGATVVSFATTLPELLVSSFAAAEGKADMAIGNAVGSVTANIGLIMAIALICMPTVIRRRDYLLKTVLMLGATAVLLVFCQGGALPLAPCALLIVIFAAAMAENVTIAVRTLRAEGDGGRPDKPTGKEIARNLVMFVVGVVGIVWGADLLVDYGSALARLVGVPERIIAVTLIAVGTSLPELVTTLTAIAKKQASLSAGNIIGANIIDLTLILPVSALLSGGALPVSPQAAAVDLPVCLAVGALALLPALAAKKFARWQGAALLALYSVYVVVTCMGIV